jgi:hypothetical protein
VYHGVEIETWSAKVGLGRRVPTFLGEPRPWMAEAHYSQNIGTLTLSFAGTPSYSPDPDCPPESERSVFNVQPQTLDVAYANWLTADFKLTFRPRGQVTYGVTVGGDPGETTLRASGDVTCLPDGTKVHALTWTYSNPGVGNGRGKPGNWLHGSDTFKSGNTYNYKWSLQPLKHSPLGIPPFLAKATPLGARSVFAP